MNVNLEKKLARQGYGIVVGIDEVGRGAWAGPIVAAATIISKSTIQDFRQRRISPRLTKFKFLKDIKDSKQLSPKKREELFELIKINFPWSIGLVEVNELDEMGVGEATKLAMRRAVENLDINPDYLLVDYIKDIGLTTPTDGIKDGDNKVLSIAAASIVAKVHRDRLMIDCHRKYSKWRFDAHKGYGTRLHQQRLQQFGICKIHRTSFCPINRIMNQDS
jgi:ribonuclease HII